MTDANDNTTYYEYNYNNQLITVKDALGNVTTYAYGSTGCPSCGGGVDKLTSLTDANGHATTYEYDTLGRLVKETDPLGNTITYTYDAKGNLTTKTAANGNTVSYSYDSLGRMIKKTYPDNTTATFTYDAKGNILTATNANISYTFTYDKDGRVTNVTDSNSRDISYQYNALGNKTQMVYPEGSKVTYNYDKANRLSSIVNGGGRTYAFQYDSLGRRTKLIYPNGVTTSYTYDNAGRLTNLLTQDPANRVINTYAYTLDKVGNRLTKTEPDVKYTYGYDAIYRLLQSLPLRYTDDSNGREAEHEQDSEHENHHGREAYTYDPAGNRLTSPNNRTTYTYNQGNQLTNDSRHQYEYDKNGNLTKKTEITDDGKAETRVYTYDYENRLIKAVKQDEEEITAVTFKYDPFGRRIEKKVTASTPAARGEEKSEDAGSRTHTYVYNSQNIIFEYITKTEDGESRTETTRYIHGTGMDENLALERKGELYYYHADGLGSITALTDKRQKVVQTYEYDSFGNVKQHGDRVKQPYTFTGREWDKETGLYYYRARYYDAKVGRFIEKDPIGFRGGINLYAYVKNNPVRYVDPFGLSFLLFNPSTGTLTLYDSNGNQVGQPFDAANNVTSTSNGPIMPGTYAYQGYNAHPESGLLENMGRMVTLSLMSQGV